jgi:hypothetical protein
MPIDRDTCYATSVTKSMNSVTNIIRYKKMLNHLIQKLSFPQSSVADPGCLSQIPDPDFYPSRISDPKIATKGRDVRKKICCHTIFCSHKFHKNVNYFIFEMLKKLIWANFQRIIELFTKKIVNKL